MRRYVYIVGISLIAASVLFELLVSTGLWSTTVYSSGDVGLMQFYYAMTQVIRGLANPVPFFLDQYTPKLVETLLRVAVALAIGRRIYLWVNTGAAAAPATMTRFQLAVIVIALVCISVVLANLLLGLAGVDLLAPVAFFGVPGIFLLSPGILWVEAIALRSDRRTRNDA